MSIRQIKLESSEKIRTLSLLLASGAVMLSGIYIGIKPILYLGGQVDSYLISVYSFIPPNYFPNPLPVQKVIQIVIPFTPIKDLLYGTILGALFIIVGYIRFKLRWLLHLFISLAGFGYMTLLITDSNHNINFIGTKLIIIFFSILIAITGLMIYRNK